MLLQLELILIKTRIRVLDHRAFMDGSLEHKVCWESPEAAQEAQGRRTWTPPWTILRYKYTDITCFSFQKSHLNAKFM